MKNNIKKLTATIMVSLLCSCSASTETMTDIDYVFSTKSEKVDFDFSETNLQESTEIIESFTVMDDNRTAVLKSKVESADSYTFAIYENGEIAIEKAVSPFYREIYYNSDADCFYSYNTEKKQLHIMNSEFDYVDVIADSFEAFEIKNMDIIGNKLYLLSVTKNIYTGEEISIDEKTGYMNFGEAVFCIDLSEKKEERLDIKNVICQSASNNTLYYYTCKNNKYELCIYDTATGTLKSVRDMSDIGYIFSFVVSEDEMIYIDSKRAEIKRHNLNTGFTVSGSDEVYITRNSDFKMYKNSLIYLNRITMDICRYKNSDSQNNSVSEFAGKDIVIGGWAAQYLPIDTNTLLADSGINASVYTYPVYEDEIMVKLLASDSDVDIYIFTTAYSLGRDLRRIKYYEPITSTAAINELNECFESISAYAYADNGEIWCLPLRIDTNLTFYVPENLKSLGIKAEELETINGYFNSLEKVKADKNYSFFARTMDFGDNAIRSYNINYSYNDYDTNLFIETFERIYSGGWLAYSYDRAEHPLFNNPAAIENGAIKSLDTDTVAFRYCNSSDFLHSINDISKWRGKATPKIGTSDEKSPAILTYAVINPYSNKKDVAKEYLSIIAEGNFKYKKTSSFMYKDQNVYNEYIDTNSDLFNDLYLIFKNTDVWEPIMPTGFDITHIEDYQNGKITAKEAAQYLQRQAEMAQNE